MHFYFMPAQKYRKGTEAKNKQTKKTPQNLFQYETDPFTLFLYVTLRSDLTVKFNSTGYYCDLNSFYYVRQLWKVYF